jgi:PilZ domain
MTSGSKKESARKHERVTVDVSLRVHREGSPAPTAGRSHDISCEGMSFYAPLELALGEVVRVAFELPNSRVRFALSAVVRNRIGFRYGVGFREATAAELAEIERVTAILGLIQS